jgi:hypothetical protein
MVENRNARLHSRRCPLLHSEEIHPRRSQGIHFHWSCWISLTRNPLKDPQSEINSEQTASWISFLLFSFMTPSVMEGYRNPHLAYEKLPPLCDYDRGEYIAKQVYKVKSFRKDEARFEACLSNVNTIGGLSMAS